MYTECFLTRNTDKTWVEYTYELLVTHSSSDPPGNCSDHGCS